MVDVLELRGIIARRGETKRSVARGIKMPESTFYNKMASGSFGADDMAAVSDYLKMTDIEKLRVFFATKDT